MSLSDTDTTIVADLANAGQRITTLTSNLVSLQALMGNVATTSSSPTLPRQPYQGFPRLGRKPPELRTREVGKQLGRPHQPSPCKSTV